MTELEKNDMLKVLEEIKNEIDVMFHNSLGKYHFEFSSIEPDNIGGWRISSDSSNPNIFYMNNLLDLNIQLRCDF